MPALASPSHPSPPVHHARPIRASAPCSPPTALCMLEQFVALKEGDTVIQNGATSAVGQVRPWVPQAGARSDAAAAGSAPRPIRPAVRPPVPCLRPHAARHTPAAPLVRSWSSSCARRAASAASTSSATGAAALAPRAQPSRPRTCARAEQAAPARPRTPRCPASAATPPLPPFLGRPDWDATVEWLRGMGADIVAREADVKRQLGAARGMHMLWPPPGWRDMQHGMRLLFPCMR